MGFFVFFQIFFGRLGLTIRLESREKVDKKEKTFLKKVLTRRMSPEYNGVSQGDTPSPPWGGGGGSNCRAKRVGTVYAVPYCITLQP